MNKEDAIPLAFSLPDLDRAIEIPKNSEKISKTLEKITSNPKIWFNRDFFSDYCKHQGINDFSLEKIHVFGKRKVYITNKMTNSPDLMNDF